MVQGEEVAEAEEGAAERILHRLAVPVCMLGSSERELFVRI